MTDLEKVLGKTGARKFWDKVLGNVKILTGDVAYNTKGDLQTQINAVADTASTAKTTADAAKTAAEDAKVAAGEIVTDTTDKFDSTKDYAVGDYVIYDNKAWKFTTVHPAGAWDESHVEQTNILAEIAAQNKNFVKLDENMQNRFKIMKFQLPPDTTANTKVYTATESDLMDYFPVGISAYVQSDTDAFWINNAEHIQQVLLRADGIYITLKSTYLVNQWARLLLCRYPT